MEMEYVLCEVGTKFYIKLQEYQLPNGLLRWPVYSNTSPIIFWRNSAHFPSDVQFVFLGDFSKNK
jgi:hypothetical protein